MLNFAQKGSRGLTKRAWKVKFQALFVIIHYLAKRATIRDLSRAPC